MNLFGLESHLKNLEFYKTQGDVMRLVTEQIVKDFRAVSIELSYENSYCDEETILDFIKDPLNFILEERPEILSPLLYRMDIPDKATTNALISMTPVQALAHLIYEREIKKVVTRLYFSGKL